MISFFNSKKNLQLINHLILFREFKYFLEKFKNNKNAASQ